MEHEELAPCPECQGEISLYTNIEKGVFARCKRCKSEFDVCDMAQVPLYRGVKIRKSTIRKIKKLWNGMVNKNGAD